MKKFFATFTALSVVFTLLLTYTATTVINTSARDQKASLVTSVTQMAHFELPEVDDHIHEHNTPDKEPAPKPTPVATPVHTPKVAAATTPTTPYSLTMTGVASDLSTLGYSLNSLRSQSITVQAHNGAIPKRCRSGPSGGLTSQGLALRRTNYTPCPDGSQPIYEAYRPEPYTCSVVYNKNSSKRLAILAHEIGHCLHQIHGEYRMFDIQYKELRAGTADLSRSAFREVIADDFMICYHGLDTAYGSGSYYVAYDIPYPTAEQCSAFNALVTTHLIK